LGLLHKTAFEALVGAMPLVGPEVYERARERLAQSARRVPRSRREERITELSEEILDAASEVSDLALGLLAEARDLAEALGAGRVPEPAVDFLEPEEAGADDRLVTTGRLEIRPAGPGPIRFGPLSVSWDAVPGTHDLTVTVRADPVLSVPLHLTLLAPGAPEPVSPVPWGTPDGHTLAAGAPGIRLTRALTTGAPAAGTLSVNGLLLFRSA
jgi:hypothetical protein